MKRLMVFALPIVILITAFQASAMSVRQYESRTKQERVEFVADAIEKIVADVAEVDPKLSKAIHDYFYVTPPGKVAPRGIIAFEGDLLAIEDAADQGKLDRNKVQIEGILLGVVKRDLIAKQKAENR